MAFDVSTITGYVAANEKQLIGKTLIKGKTASLVSKQTGVKGSAYLNLLVADSPLAAGGCGWNAGGTTTLTTRQIKTGQIKVNQSFCDKTLIGTAFEYGVKVAVGDKTLPFEEDFINQNILSIQRQLEDVMWKGDTTASTYLGRFDGYIKVLAGSAGVVDVTAAAALTSTNAVAEVNKVIAAIKDEIIDATDLVIFAPYEYARAYVAGLQAANLFHYTADYKNGFDFTIPGTNIRMVAVAGLNTTKKMYAGQLSNFFMGTDLVGNEEKFMFWYSEDNSEFRLKVEFNAGVQVAFPDLIVRYLGA